MNVPSKDYRKSEIMVSIVCKWPSMLYIGFHAELQVTT